MGRREGGWERGERKEGGRVGGWDGWVSGYVEERGKGRRALERGRGREGGIRKERLSSISGLITNTVH